MSNHAHTLACLLTGHAHTITPVDEAVAARVEKLITANDPRLAPIDEDHPRYMFGVLYDGNRTAPESIAWRFEQNYRDTFWTAVANRGTSAIRDEILQGLWDTALIDTYHDAASSEYWYRYEKDWGSE
jgi:hypothetical protein